MKKIILSAQILFIILFVSLFPAKSFSQISVVSTTGYQVNLNVYPAGVSTSNCGSWGYNFTVQMAYNISFSGNNIPSSLYTLQGTVGCGPGAIFFNLPNNGGSGSVSSSNSSMHNASCGNASVSNIGCNTVNIQIQGPGISYRTISFTPATALSVKLVDFAVAAENNRVKINWSTATETDNDHFTVERSSDGSDWSAVATVKGAGNSTSLITYQAYDESPVNGTSYYRLKQTDFDGKATYSATDVVKLSGLAKNISLFPVPNASNTVNIKGITDYSNHDFSLINTSGKIVFTTTLSKSSVDLPSVETGIYIVRLTDKITGESQSIRYVKI